MQSNTPSGIPEIPVIDASPTAPKPERFESPFSPPFQRDPDAPVTIALPKVSQSHRRSSSGSTKPREPIKTRGENYGSSAGQRTPLDRSSRVSFLEDKEHPKLFRNPMADPNETNNTASVGSRRSSNENSTISRDFSKPPINNRLRYRYLFFGLLLIFVGSIYGTYVVFSLFLKLYYNFSFLQEINIFVGGTTGGLCFATLVGMCLDHFGHRLPMVCCVFFCFLGSLLIGLLFDGYIKMNQPNVSFFFFLLNAGGYGLNVIAIVVAVTHFPRNRGMVCGMYQALSGLAASFFGALFRGFFGSSLPNMYYFCTSIVAALGTLCFFYFHPAPYVDYKFYRAVRMLRAERNTLIPSDLVESLQKKMSLFFKLKVPFMKYRLPKRRSRISFAFLFLLNVFMTVQVLLVAYKDITSRGTLCVFSAIALVLLLLLTVLIWPFNFLDEKVDYRKDSIDIGQNGSPLVQNANASEAYPKTSTVELYRVTRGVLGMNVEDLSFSDGRKQPFGSSFASGSGLQGSLDQGKTVDAIVSDELKQLTPADRVGINHDTVSELLKYRDGWVKAICTIEFWMLIWLSFVIWGSGLVMTNNIFIQMLYMASKKGVMPTTTYYLYSAISGVLIGIGRMTIGVVADDILPALRKYLKKPFELPFTSLMIIPPWLCTIGVFLQLVVPDTKGLLAGYVFLSFGFGLCTSSIPYAVTSFFSCEHVGMGKMYGFCLLAVGLGVTIFYRALFFEVYNKNAYPSTFPVVSVRGVCLEGKDSCAQTFLVLTFLFDVSAGIVAIFLHLIYQRKMNAMAERLITAVSSGGAENARIHA